MFRNFGSEIDPSHYKTHPLLHANLTSWEDNNCFNCSVAGRGKKRNNPGLLMTKEREVLKKARFSLMLTVIFRLARIKKLFSHSPDLSTMVKQAQLYKQGTFK